MSEQESKQGVSTTRVRYHRPLAARVPGWLIPLYAWQYRKRMKWLHRRGRHSFRRSYPMGGPVGGIDWCHWCGLRAALTQENNDE